MLGMNDGGYRAFDQELFQTYRSGLEHIVWTVKSSLANTRITLLGPSPYDDVTQPPAFPRGYNSVPILKWLGKSFPIVFTPRRPATIMT
jgi:hypothetical protein